MFHYRDFYRRLTEQSSLTSNYHFFPSIFFKFAEIKFGWIHCLQKSFYFYYFFKKLFLFQSKNEKCGGEHEWNFLRHCVEWKKHEHHFVKKLVCEQLEFLLIYFEIFMGNSGSSKKKMFTRKKLFSVGSFTRKCKLFFDKTFSQQTFQCCFNIS